MPSTLEPAAARPDDSVNLVRQLRNAFGQYPTGVTVITATAQDGRKIGLTANSFASLSLDPPLVLWSISKMSPNCSEFTHAGYFAINVLAKDQIELSRRFSKAAPDKYAGVACRESVGGTTIIDGCTAHFVCRNVAQHEGGDHVIFVGQIEHFRADDHAPLVFHLGQYGALANR